ncbi:hypothetical protein TrVGV298_001651 [Trichoderma virens]|nr:hypothetical protein TrVGV298_001651 [Trichoderma virens]
MAQTRLQHNLLVEKDAASTAVSTSTPKSPCCITPTLNVGKWESSPDQNATQPHQDATCAACSIGINATWQHSLLAAQELDEIASVGRLGSDMGIITAQSASTLSICAEQVTNDEGLGRQQGQRPSLVAETVGGEPSQRTCNGHDTPPSPSIGTVCRQSLLESLPLRERVKGAAPLVAALASFEP